MIGSGHLLLRCVRSKIKKLDLMISGVKVLCDSDSMITHLSFYRSFETRQITPHNSHHGIDRSPVNFVA